MCRMQTSPNFMRLNRGKTGLLFDYVVDRYISLTYIV